MRIGFKVLDRGAPVSKALIVGNLLPPVMTTDDEGEAFGIAPFGLLMLPALMPMYNAIFIVVKDGKFMASSDIAPETENYYTVDIGAQTRHRETLGGRIPGDGFFKVDMTPLDPNELQVIKGNAVLAISNCGLCAYLQRLKSQCLVNGPGRPIPIEEPLVTTCRVYTPFFLPPSPQRFSRDLSRLA